MSPSIDFIAVLVLIGIALGLLLLLLHIGSTKGNKRANRMLCIFVFVSSHIIIENFSKMFHRHYSSNYYKEQT